IGTTPPRTETSRRSSANDIPDPGAEGYRAAARCSDPPDGLAQVAAGRPAEHPPEAVAEELAGICRAPGRGFVRARVRILVRAGGCSRVHRGFVRRLPGERCRRRRT